MSYFDRFKYRQPPVFKPFSRRRRGLWQFFAGLTIGCGAIYIYLRWSVFLNPEALLFSCVMAASETLAFIGTLIFVYDIWDEPPGVSPSKVSKHNDMSSPPAGGKTIDVFIATYDEPIEILEPTIRAAKLLKVPTGASCSVHLLDDGARSRCVDLADRMGVGYFARSENRGFKAGNLANAIFQTDGEFFVICDADTQLFETFLVNTVPYFEDRRVAWVQTPHWFYDVPEGETWHAFLCKNFGRRSGIFAPVFKFLNGHSTVFKDHYLANPALFFDVIQRRRDRNSASFCCGAASIHRREAVLECALNEKGRQLKSVLKKTASGQGAAINARLETQPFAYHVSEDFLTSVTAHANGWNSVYHPMVESRMLSPWSAHAWAMQRLKYACGAFDILLHSNPLQRGGLPWKVKLHYLATFWSYASVLYLPILMFAPVWSLAFGIAPVSAYSFQYFAYLLPVLIFNECAMLAGCKGHGHQAAKTLEIGSIMIKLRAAFQAAKGERPSFPPTPKVPGTVQTLRYASPNILFLFVFLGAICWGIYCFLAGREGYELSFVVMNLFWIFWSLAAVTRIALALSFAPTLPNTTRDILT